MTRNSPINSAAARFQRSDFANERVRLYFIFFLLFTFFVVGYFVIEDYQNSIHLKLEQITLAHPETTAAGIPTYLGKPANLFLLGCWLFCSGFFVVAFNRRVKPLLYLFLTLATLVLILFFFWNSLVEQAVTQSNQFWVRTSMQFEPSSPASLTYKAFLLVFWSAFSVFLAFSVITAKYLGVFARLDYLFQSICNGNWDANMFFRSGDRFSFVAESFNTLKSGYLDQVYDLDDQLIFLKDTLAEETFSESTRQKLLESLVRSDITDPPAG